MSEQNNSTVNFHGNQSLTGLLLESVMTHASDAIVLTDPSDEITDWNKKAEDLFGYEAKEAIGRSITIILDGDSLSRLRAVNDAPNTLLCRKRDGTAISVSTRFNEVIDRNKNLLALCFIFRDGREDARQQALMKENERAMESFMYSISHDLRAPLRRIVNYAEILQEDHLSSMDEEVERLVSRMSKNAEKMGTLINDLLSYFRVTQQSIKKSLVNVEMLVSHLTTELKNSPENTHIKFDIKTLPSVQADLSLLTRVFENLIGNAIKFTRVRENPTIEIGSKSDEGSIHFFVKDNGVGFDQQYAFKLFNIFQRLHNPTDYDGTGIGLAIVQQIISRQGGKVWAEGKIDDGAVFWFSLPKEVS